MDRRLATILAADVVGYSARMGEAETDTIERLATLRQLAEETVRGHGGRVFSRAGDGLLAEFASPVRAVRAGYELQRELQAPANRNAIGLQLRVGIHLADVVVDGGDLLGDGVNIASRIEGIAEAGMVLISQSVFEQVKRSAQLTFECLGARRLKNIRDAVALYQVVGELANHSCATAGAAAAAIASEPRPPRPSSVVVVPFINMSGDPDQEYFAEGFSEDVITELSRFSGIFVISRNASFGLKGLGLDARDIGPRVGARFCLEGGVRRLGERIRITSHLTDTLTGEQIWSEKNDCSFAELFDVQDDLVARIVASVAGRIERHAEAGARRKRPADLEAYDCLLRGLEYHRIGGVTKDNARQALHWFNAAVEKDPHFGRAHAWRACAVATLAEWDGTLPWDELWAAGQLAVQYDETDAECHRIVGSLALYRRDFDRARYHFGRALELNPHHAYLVGRMGELYNFLGDGARALEYQERARALDPFLPEYCRELEAVAYYVLGQFQECCRVVGEFARLTRRAAAYRAAAATHLDHAELLAKAVDRLMVLDPRFDPKAFVATEFYRDRELRDRLLADLRAACALRPAAPGDLAAGMASAGKRTEDSAGLH